MLAAALLLIGAWGLTAFLQTAQVARDALSGLTVSASAVAASIDAPLEHFADVTDGFRAADFQTIDRVALTSRLLRLQSALPPVGATFVVERRGQLLAASVAIFCRRRLGRRYRLVPPRYRRQRDAAGAAARRIRGCGPVHPRCSRAWCAMPRARPAGLVGAVLRTEDLNRLVGRTWLGPGVSIEFRGSRRLR